MKAFGALLALSLAAVAFIAPGNAAADDHAVAYADLNGDRRIDRVYVQPVSGTEQKLVAVVGTHTYTTQLPMDDFAGVQPLRVVDFRGDRRQEIVVTEVVGANTLWFSVWGFSDGWRPIRNPDGTHLRLYEGGGISAISRYGCVLVGGHRELVAVGATLNWEDGIYSGQRVSYTVDGNGVALPTSNTQVSGDRAFIEGMADPHSCV